MNCSYEHYARKLLASKGKTEVEASALLIAVLVAINDGQFTNDMARVVCKTDELAKLDAEIYGAHSLSPLFLLPEKYNSEDLGLF